MEEMKKPDAQITLYLDPKSRMGKEAIAYAELQELKVLILDVTKDHISPTTYADLLGKMDGVEANELLDHQALNGANPWDFDAEDVCSMLSKDSKFLKYPIAERGRKAIPLRTPSLVLQITEVG